MARAMRYKGMLPMYDGTLEWHIYLLTIYVL